MGPTARKCDCEEVAIPGDDEALRRLRARTSAAASASEGQRVLWLAGLGLTVWLVGFAIPWWRDRKVMRQ